MVNPGSGLLVRRSEAARLREASPAAHSTTAPNLCQKWTGTLPCFEADSAARRHVAPPVHTRVEPDVTGKTDFDLCLSFLEYFDLFTQSICGDAQKGPSSSHAPVHAMHASWLYLATRGWLFV